MSPVPTETALMLTALLLGAAPIERTRVMRGAAAVPPWMPFAVLCGLGIASTASTFMNSGLIAQLGE